MGQFIFTLDAVGNHGCERQVGDGGHVVGCEKPGCTDCACRELVRRLKRSGATLTSATIEHWPGTDGSVVDDLLTGTRAGGF